VLDSLTRYPLKGGRLVQVSSSFGMEALLAAMYKPELEACISVMVSSNFREVDADDVAVALNTFRRCLEPASPVLGAAFIRNAPAPATVITKFRDCWSSLRITHFFSDKVYLLLICT